MYTLAYGLEIMTLLCALIGVSLATMSIWQSDLKTHLVTIEKASLGITFGHVVASWILLYGLINYDFSVDYIASYTDLTLPLFYRLTAFWAGQAGSLLFWTLMIALCNAVFQYTTVYKAFSDETKQWYWIFYCLIMAFFSLLLTTWSDPFTTTIPAPVDGRGLNPLLQNPGMIIHPPLLFLGYGGFTIPSCIALAQAMSKSTVNEASWFEAGRPFIITAWIFLTAGILLGAWWAYMELGWGGYWAWDPVENASLLPWLIATAMVHTVIIEQRRNKLHRVNIFLIALTTVSAFFATYLVRGNVVDSVHAFGSGGVGPALLLFVLFSLFVSVVVAFSAEKQEGSQELAGIDTREGFLVFTAWLLITLTIVILFATLWPVISRLWSAQSIGFDQRFYNTVCLPLFALLAALLVVCPYLGWNGGIKEKKNLAIVGIVCVLMLVFCFVFSFTTPLALIASIASIGAITSSLLQIAKPSVRAYLPTLAAHGVHIGVALIVLGVSFSSAYKIEEDIHLASGASHEIGGYTILLNELYEGSAPTFDFLEAELAVFKNEKLVGQLNPQIRIYTKFSQQSFSEVGTMPSLINEFYASLHGLDDNHRAVLRVSINPLVNWIWIGSFLMCMFPFLSLTTNKKRED